MSRGRLTVVGVSLAVVALAFVWRLVDLQLTPDAALAGEVGSQVRIIDLRAPRGEIVDRHGRSIALSLPRPSVVADPRLVPADQVDDVVDALSGLLSTDAEVLADRLRLERAFVYLERQVDNEVGEAVMDLGLPGVSLVDEPRREHPIGECSGLAVVGRVDIDQRGISGLEEAYDDHLTGDDGFMVRQTQIGGDVQIPGGSQVVEPVEPGGNLRVTLQRDIQFQAEQRLVRALEETGGGLGIAIVTDPLTGEILAMANVLRDEETNEVRCTTNNLAVTWAYEPGSIMKPLTFSAVFEHDAWDVADALHIEDRIVIPREQGLAPKEYDDINLERDETHTPAWIMEKSSNNGTIMLARKLGAERLESTFRRFGLGTRSALEFKGEARGILDELDSHALELSNAAIGQSVAVTPIQMIVAYNTLATSGLRVSPSLVVGEPPRREPERVVSAETAQTVLGLMRGVVTDGTGTQAQIPGFVVAGKTGTAWQPCSVEFGYECVGGGRHYTASFGGIVENDLGPVLSVLVVVDDPHGGDYGGGTVAAPVFADIASFALRQLRIPPSSVGMTTSDRVRAAPAVQPVGIDETDEVAE